jgi:heme/copper-type cytochrome/quinol oxidase subunit 2
MAMGIIFYEVGLVIVITIFVVVISVGAAWFVKEHDKRADYYKKQAEICWRENK